MHETCHTYEHILVQHCNTYMSKSLFDWHCNRLCVRYVTNCNIVCNVHSMLLCVLQCACAVCNVYCSVRVQCAVCIAVCVCSVQCVLQCACAVCSVFCSAWHSVHTRLQFVTYRTHSVLQCYVWTHLYPLINESWHTYKWLNHACDPIPVIHMDALVPLEAFFGGGGGGEQN